MYRFFDFLMADHILSGSWRGGMLPLQRMPGVPVALAYSMGLGDTFVGIKYEREWLAVAYCVMLNWLTR